MLSRLTFSLLFFALIAACDAPQTDSSQNEADSQVGATTNDTLRYPEETHLRNLRQLTFGGDNAEAYFSFNDQMVTMQRAWYERNIPCDQIYVGNLPESDQDPFSLGLVSTGQGRTTCSYFLPGDSLVVFASTHHADPACPPEIDRSKVREYVWPIYDSYDIYVADLQGNIVRRLTDTPGYDAEATVSPRGDKIVFTSTRDGDLDLYTMNLDGSDVRRITDSLGYDGGAFFSPDGSKLIFRASRPKTPEAREKYRRLLAEGMVAPSDMELYVCNADGSDLRRITNLGKANWAPFYHPSGEKIIFASNHAYESGRRFNLYMIGEDGTGLEQITFDPTFDAFPMFSFDGTKLMFSSNRYNGGTRETNVFIGDWVE